MLRSIFIVLLFPIFLSACDMGKTEGYTVISVTDAYQRIKESTGDTIFLDVRTPGEFENGHVPGATLIPVQSLASRLNEVPKDKRIIVYCEAGGRAAKAAEILVADGFTQVENMKASMRGWRGEDLPIEK